MAKDFKPGDRIMWLKEEGGARYWVKDKVYTVDIEGRVLVKEHKQSGSAGLGTYPSEGCWKLVSIIVKDMKGI